jgi:hypothetical protein
MKRPAPPLIVAMLAGLLAVGCAGGEESVAGIVTDVDTLGLGRVQGFTLLTPDGTALDFEFSGGTDLSSGGFPPDHLFEHLATGVGVAVAYRTEDGRRIPVRLADAEWIGR